MFKKTTSMFMFFCTFSLYVALCLAIRSNNVMSKHALPVTLSFCFVLFLALQSLSDNNNQSFDTLLTTGWKMFFFQLLIFIQQSNLNGIFFLLTSNFLAKCC